MKESKIFIRTTTIVVAAVLTAVAVPVSGLWGTLTTLGYGLCLYLLQQTFQKDDSQGKIFYSFLFLGLSSTICLQAIVFLPVIWIAMAVFFGSMSVKAFSASILGMLTPYWFLIPAFLLTGRQDALVQHFCSLVTDMQIPDYTQLSVWPVLIYALLLIADIICTMFYFQTDTKENIHQSTSVKAFLVISLFAAIIPAAQPQLLPYFIGMMTMGESMVVAIMIQKLRIKGYR